MALHVPMLNKAWGWKKYRVVALVNYGWGGECMFCTLPWYILAPLPPHKPQLYNLVSLTASYESKLSTSGYTYYINGPVFICIAKKGLWANGCNRAVWRRRRALPFPWSDLAPNEGEKAGKKWSGNCLWQKKHPISQEDSFDNNVNPTSLTPKWLPTLSEDPQILQCMICQMDVQLYSSLSATAWGGE